jgi:hypothetical protein
VEACLVREAQRGAEVEIRVRHARQLDLQPGALRGVEFALQLLAVAGGIALHQVAVEAAEVAVDLLGRDDGGDLLDRAGVALCRHSRAVGAMPVLELVVAVVERIGQVRRGAQRGAAADRPVVQHHHRAALPRQQVGGRQPGDAGADDADVAARVLGQRLRRGQRRVGVPERSGAA